MTILYEAKAECGICGSESEFTGIGSTNEFGSSDLDTRPPEMRRSTIFAWVQRCPQCGYCESDVTKSIPGSKLVMDSKEYKNQLSDPEYPELANSFLCQAIINREAKDYAAASWAQIHSAWSCDDADLPDKAVLCRQKAAEMIMLAEKYGQQVVDQEEEGTAILVDLLRRSGRLEQARQVIATRRAKITEDIRARVIAFQIGLIDRNDSSCHTIGEALGESE